MKDYSIYLGDILTEIEYLQKTSVLLAYEDFIDNPTLRRAFVRSIEIIGEAVKQIPAEIRDRHSGIEWSAIARTRDKVIHHYSGVNYRIIWDIVQNEITPLKNAILAIAADEGIQLSLF